MIRAAIFDLDGLLIDSEPLWQDAELEVFGALGVPLTHAHCLQTRGLRIDEVVVHWHQRYPWSDPPLDVVTARVVDAVIALIRARGRALPGALEAIALARRHCEKLAVASSSPALLIETALDAFGVRGQFDAVHSAEHEAFGKPHPAVYLATARTLGVAPTECVALEDSLAGVLAAKAARMYCIAVPDPAQRADPRFAIADAVLGSLVELDPPAWRGLLARWSD